MAEMNNDEPFVSDCMSELEISKPCKKKKKIKEYAEDKASQVSCSVVDNFMAGDDELEAGRPDRGEAMKSLQVDSTADLAGTNEGENKASPCSSVKLSKLESRDNELEILGMEPKDSKRKKKEKTQKFEQSYGLAEEHSVPVQPLQLRKYGAKDTVDILSQLKETNFGLGAQMNELEPPSLENATNAPDEPNEGSEKDDIDLNDLMIELDGSESRASQKKKAKKRKKNRVQKPKCKENTSGLTSGATKKDKMESVIARKIREQQKQIDSIEEAEQSKRDEEERKIVDAEHQRMEEEEKKAAARAKKKAAMKARKEKQKAEGTYLTKAQRKKRDRDRRITGHLHPQAKLPLPQKLTSVRKSSTSILLNKGQASGSSNTTEFAEGLPSEEFEALINAQVNVVEKQVEDSNQMHDSEKALAICNIKPISRRSVCERSPDTKLNVAAHLTSTQPEPAQMNYSSYPEGVEGGASDQESEQTITEQVNAAAMTFGDAAQMSADENELASNNTPSTRETNLFKQTPNTKSIDAISGSLSQIERAEVNGCENTNSVEGGGMDEQKDGSAVEKQLDVAKRQAEDVRRMRETEKAQAMQNRSPDHLRSLIVCIMGHVDTGKTKILDRIRRTNVQDGEAGGITQQIGASYLPIDSIKKETKKLDEGKRLTYRVPSLLIIDTPGHASFTNLRSRGSSLCDIAIVVIDIMHGIEKQTRESLELLKQRRTPFVVALNKIDRIFDWKEQHNNCPTRHSLMVQEKYVQDRFVQRVGECKLALAELGLNSELYWRNKDFRRSISIVPTSAITGEGIPDLLLMLVALSQKLLVERLMFNSYPEATVLEVKAIVGLGTTIDVIITGGELHKGDTIVVVGLNGPITANIRALLTPHPMKEMRMKGDYIRHSAIKAAQSVKIVAEGLDYAVAGTQIVVVQDPKNAVEMAYANEEVMIDCSTVISGINKSGIGVLVHASTLGSLEALLMLLTNKGVPVSDTRIGPVHKRSVKKAAAMLERDITYGVILAFDVKVDNEAKVLADHDEVPIFKAEIIYHLFDQFEAHRNSRKILLYEKAKKEVVFPVVCRIMPEHVLKINDPVILGVQVKRGILKLKTPLVVRKDGLFTDIGYIAEMRCTNGCKIEEARRGDQASIRIISEGNVTFGNQFDADDNLISSISRKSIDLLKKHFRDELSGADWQLIIDMKKWFEII